MVDVYDKIRYILQHHFDRDDTMTEAREKICALYGDDVVSLSTVSRWYARFRSGNFDVKDAPRCGRPTVENVDKVVRKIEENRHVSSREIALDLNIDHTTVLSYLQKAGYEKKLDVWVPCKLTMRNLLERVLICETLKKRNAIEPFLTRLITGDVKWIRYESIRKRSWTKREEYPQTTAQSKLTPNKVMLSIWWDWKGIVYYEFLPPGQTIDSSLYYQQLTRLYQAVKEKRPELANTKGIVFHHDNTRPHTSLITQQRLKELGWEVLLHPPYSPDLTPSDYHLFRPMQTYCNNIRLMSKEDCENVLPWFIAQKTQEFYSNGIMDLPQRWQEVIDQNGKYLNR